MEQRTFSTTSETYDHHQPPFSYAEVQVSQRKLLKLYDIIFRLLVVTAITTEGKASPHNHSILTDEHGLWVK